MKHELFYAIYTIIINLRNLTYIDASYEERCNQIIDTLLSSSEIDREFIESHQSLTYETFAGAWEKWQQRTAI